mmetsp:Transcript_35852/g.60417  ORF Transcript_35852/g.60417 Transcript_35852/m.60417 type:complete len:278 (+) Transcript_35852:753-1586(+)
MPEHAFVLQAVMAHGHKISVVKAALDDACDLCSKHRRQRVRRFGLFACVILFLLFRFRRGEAAPARLGIGARLLGRRGRGRAVHWCGNRGAGVSEEVDLLVVVQELAVVLAERKRAARAGRRAIERRQNLLPEFVLDNLFKTAFVSDFDVKFVKIELLSRNVWDPLEGTSHCHAKLLEGAQKEICVSSHFLVCGHGIRIYGYGHDGWRFQVYIAHIQARRGGHHRDKAGTSFVYRHHRNVQIQYNEGFVSHRAPLAGHPTLLRCGVEGVTEPVPLST